MRRAIAAVCAALLIGWSGPRLVLAQNFGIIDPGAIIGNPSQSPAPARPFVPAGVGASPAQFGGKANDATVDNATALNNALSSGRGPIVIKGNETFYVGSTVNIPDRAHLFCEPGGTIKRLASYTRNDGAALVRQSSTYGSMLEGCTIDLNTPAWGNWHSGLMPNGNTANAVVRDITINDASFKGLDWDDINWTNTHTNDYFQNIVVNRSGWTGAIFQGLRGGSYVGNVRVISSGAEGIQFLWNKDSVLDHPYVNKSTPPGVLFGGQMATTSSNSATIGNSGNLVITVAPGLPWTTNNYVKMWSVAHPTNWMEGKVVGYNNITGLVFIHLTGSGGSGTYNDWQITAETGMLLFQSINTRVQITSPVLVDNVNAVSDGLGAGENGMQSSTTITVPTTLPATLSFSVSGVAVGFGNMPGLPITVITPEDFGVEMHGHIVSLSGGTLTVVIESAKGSGSHSDWQLNSEADGPVTVTSPNIYRAGLFGLDCTSNMHVIGGEVREASQRGGGAGWDLGGRLSNCQLVGTAIRDTGLPIGGVTSNSTVTIAKSGTVNWVIPAGTPYQQGFRVVAYDQAGYDNWASGLIANYDIPSSTITVALDSSSGSGTHAAWNVYVQIGNGLNFGNNSFTTAIVDNYFQSVPIIDSRNPNGMQLGINVDLHKLFLHNVIYDLPPILAPNGYAKSYNVFGGPPTYAADPHLNGAAFRWTLDGMTVACSGGGTATIGTNSFGEYTGGNAAITYSVEFNLSSIAGCTGPAVSVPLPPNIVTSQVINQMLPGFDRTTGVVAFSSQCQTNSPACWFQPQTLATGHAYVMTGPLTITPLW